MVIFVKLLWKCVMVRKLCPCWLRVRYGGNIGGKAVVTLITLGTGSTPILIATNGHNTHAVCQLLFVRRLLKMSK
jgi:hypothetical protein